MGRIFRPKGRKIWCFRAKVAGGRKTWSTGETDYRKAMAKLPQLEAEAQSVREQYAISCSGKGALAKRMRSVDIKLTVAIEREVSRLQTDVSEQQASRVDYALGNFLNWIGRDPAIGEINMEVLEDYQRQRLKHAAKSTVDKELIYLIRALKRCGHAVIKPPSKPGKKTKVRVLTQNELRAFFQACPDRWKILFYTMYATGARPAELIPSSRSNHKPLLKKEVNLECRMVTIRPSKVLDGQEVKERKVSIDPTLALLLKLQIDNTPGPYVFPPRTNLCHLFDEIIKQAGIPKFDELGRKLTAHSFRHTYATTFHRDTDADQFELMAALGHSQIATTAIYVDAKAPEFTINIQNILDVTPEPANKNPLALPAPPDHPPSQNGGVQGWCTVEEGMNGDGI